MTLEAYCVKCKTKREIANPQPTFTSRGTPGVKGSCPVCGTTLFRMGATEAHANLPKPEILPAAKPKAKTKAKTASKRSAKSAKTTRKSAATSDQQADDQRRQSLRQGDRQAGDRRIAGEGAQRRAVPRQRLHRQGVEGARPRPAGLADFGRRRERLRAEVPRPQRQARHRQRPQERGRAGEGNLSGDRP